LESLLPEVKRTVAPSVKFALWFLESIGCSAVASCPAQPEVCPKSLCSKQGLDHIEQFAVDLGGN